MFLEELFFTKVCLFFNISALKLYERLVKEGVHVRIVDVFSVKPFDKVTLRQCAEQTSKVLVVEDHYAEGGLGGIFICLM